MLLAVPAQAGESVGARHAQVEQDDVGIQAADERQHLRARVAFPDDFEVGRLLEGALHSLDYETVVVGNENAHREIVVGGPVVFEVTVL
jgi:hypothetical protein